MVGLEGGDESDPRPYHENLDSAQYASKSSAFMMLFFLTLVLKQR
jgi:hypothetical protein